MLQPANDSSNYYRLLKTKMEAELLLSAIRLEVFTFLSVPSSLKELAEQTGYDVRNLGFFLRALVASGFIEQQGGLYANTREGAEFLSKESPLYLGDTLLFRDGLNSLEGVDEKVRRGAISRQSAADVSHYEFARLARVVVPEMYLGRVQAFIGSLKELTENVEPPVRLLDLGGGAGIMAVEFVRAFPGASAVVFEHPAVAAVARETAEKRGVSERVSIVEGDFNRDGIGENFDVIVASGILDFAKDDLEGLLKKISAALNPRGLFYLVRRKNDEEGLLGWLPGLLDGRDSILDVKSIDENVRKCGFEQLRPIEAGRFLGEFYRKRRNSPQDS